MSDDGHVTAIVTLLLLSAAAVAALIAAALRTHIRVMAWAMRAW